MNISNPFVSRPAADKSILRRLEAITQQVTGQSVDVLRQQTLTELRRVTESKTKRKLTFLSRFPLIGRGNVMRDKIVDHATVECLLEKSLRC